MTTTATTVLQATSLVPSLTVDDLQRSIAFYETLGFGIEERWEDDGVLRGVMLQACSTREDKNVSDGFVRRPMPTMPLLSFQ